MFQHLDGLGDGEVVWHPLELGPGYILTDMNKPLIENAAFDAWVKSSNPSQRWGKPEELVGTAVYLASPASSYVNGQIIYVDGGWLAVL